MIIFTSTISSSFVKILKCHIVFHSSIQRWTQLWMEGSISVTKHMQVLHRREGQSKPCISQAFDSYWPIQESPTITPPSTLPTVMDQRISWLLGPEKLYPPFATKSTAHNKLPYSTYTICLKTKTPTVLNKDREKHIAIVFYGNNFLLDTQVDNTNHLANTEKE